MKRTIRIALLLSTALNLVACAGDNSMKCVLEENIGSGGKATRGGGLEVALNQDGIIKKLVTYSYWATGEEGGGYFCNLTYPPPKTSDMKVQFERLDDTTVIHIDEKYVGKSELRLLRTSGGYRLEFTKVERSYCARLAEFPESIEITRNNKQCKITW